MEQLHPDRLALRQSAPLRAEVEHSLRRGMNPESPKLDYGKLSFAAEAGPIAVRLFILIGPTAYV